MAPKWVSDERYEIAELGVDNSYGGADSRIVCYKSALIILPVTVQVVRYTSVEYVMLYITNATNRGFIKSQYYDDTNFFV